MISVGGATNGAVIGQAVRGLDSNGRPFGIITPEEFGATGDGIADDSVALNSALSQSVRAVFLSPGKTYKLSSALTITAAGKTIVGYGAKLLLGAGAFFKFLNSNDVTVEGLDIDGGNFTNNAAGVALETCTDIRFFKCKFHHIQRNAVHISYNTYSNNVEFEACKFYDIGGSGITVTTQGFAIYAQRINNLNVINCEILRTRGQSAIFIQRADGINIERTNIKDTWCRGIQTYSADTPLPDDIVVNMKIRDCVIKNCGGSNTGTDGLATNGIFIRNQAGKASDVIITGCTIENTGENSIEGRFTAHNNTLKNSGAYDLLGSPSKEMAYLDSNAIFTNNTLINSKNEAIKIFGAKNNNIVANNLIIDPGTFGITAQADGSGATLDGVSIDNNTIIDTQTRAVYGLRILISNGGVITSKTSVTNNKTLGISGGNFFGEGSVSPHKVNNTVDGVVT